MTEPLSLQIIGSKALGGAERWFARFARALFLIDAICEGNMTVYRSIPGK